MLAGQGQFLPHGHQFEVGLQFGFAEVSGQGARGLVFLRLQQVLQSIELPQPPRQRPGLAALHQGAHRFDRWSGGFGVGQKGHGDSRHREMGQVRLGWHESVSQAGLAALR